LLKGLAKGFLVQKAPALNVIVNEISEIDRVASCDAVLGRGVTGKPAGLAAPC
jgi:hypothetical protein